MPPMSATTSYHHHHHTVNTPYHLPTINDTQQYPSLPSPPPHSDPHPTPRISISSILCPDQTSPPPRRSTRHHPTPTPDSDTEDHPLINGQGVKGAGTIETVAAHIMISQDPLARRKTVTGVDGRRFECSFCGQLFVQLVHLSIHERRHTGERPYECRICHKTFNQKGNLKTHERRHTGDKPFKCDCNLCEKAFSQLGNLKSHIEKVHARESQASSASAYMTTVFLPSTTSRPFNHLPSLNAPNLPTSNLPPRPIQTPTLLPHHHEEEAALVLASVRSSQ
ncbi:hypothetical protein BC829DRAFT_486251 [Chytridium lagenaria]|nr:hypothetical protein BC829DRAFT_486251 [Chytridium lagenaria]